MDEVEIPAYFICPISLLIMKDPVTVATGITYDRESIEQWFLTTNDTSCPVTKQQLFLPTNNTNDIMTPNHTLRRLIQQWCTVNAVDRIPTPKFPLDNIYAVKLVRNLRLTHLRLAALKKMEALATENERNRRSLADAGAGKAMISFIVACFKQGTNTDGLLEALRVLHLVWSVDEEETKAAVIGNDEFLQSLTWVLAFDHHDSLAVKSETMLVLKRTMPVINTTQLERLKTEFFINVSKPLSEKKISKQLQVVKSALHVLIEACPWGRNRTKIVESGAIFQLIELELLEPGKHVTELIFNLLANLCCCADGRAQLLKHGGSIAMVSKRILRVSPTTDDMAVQILSSVSKFSGTNGVVLEMLLVGAVSKLCMIMQADCPAYLKNKVRGILRLHSDLWNNSPCIAVYLLTRPR